MTLMGLLSLIFPDKCPYCRQIIRSGLSECDKCRSSFPSFAEERILQSGDRCIAPFRYEGGFRSAITELKFSGIKFNAASLSKQLARVLADEAAQIDIVCWVPVSRKRRRERGFDQSELLAVKAAGLLDKEYCCLLKKIRNNAVQHELDSKRRVSNVKGVYAAARPEMIKGKHILLIDDICTTGNTLSECSRVLHSAGASSVLCAAAAMVPDPEEKNK